MPIRETPTATLKSRTDPFTIGTTKLRTQGILPIRDRNVRLASMSEYPPRVTALMWQLSQRACGSPSQTLLSIQLHPKELQQVSCQALHLTQTQGCLGHGLPPFFGKYVSSPKFSPADKEAESFSIACHWPPSFFPVIANPSSAA